MVGRDGVRPSPDDASGLEIVRVPNLPTPSGHYSHAIVHGGLIYVSGQLGRGPGTTDHEAGDITVQTRRCLGSLVAIVREAGGRPSSVLKVNVYIADIAHWPAVNAVYQDAFGEHRPARAVIPTGPLNFGALIEVDAIAAVTVAPFAGSARENS
jgi:2-iminobutanoate/2-iminopropanoate deaminase